MNISTEQKPRVVLLYRASSKMQTDSENDIPLQRNIMIAWAEKQGYEFIKEFVEGGVSGFKVSAAKRDAIVEIKAMAERREFDILRIYMSDRLGRIAEETPLIVSYLNERNIKVISYREGEINSSTHADKLMTYIRYWQAEGESLKTSMRVYDALKDRVRQGIWPGGTPPYGYRTISKGSLNYKGRPIFDVEINPEEAEVVRTIFRLYTKEHYGTKLIVKYLNDRGIKTTKGNMFNFTRVSNILKNKLYIGIFQLNKINPKQRKKKTNVEIIESPVMKDFVIIDEQSYYEAQKILAKNVQLVDKSKMQRRTVKGQLLNGMLYCGECGRKFTSHSYVTIRKKSNGKIGESPGGYYKCSSFYFPVERKNSCKQGVYNATALEQLVIRDAKEFIRTIDKENLLNNYKSQTDERLNITDSNLKRIENDISKIDKELIKLKSEVIKTLTGESKFSQELLNNLIKEKESEKHNSIPLYENLKKRYRANKLTNKNASNNNRENLNNWQTRFDTQTKEGKKAMLLNIIDKITLNNNKVEIEYKIAFDYDKITAPLLPDINNDQQKYQAPNFFTQNCVNGAMPLKRFNTLTRLGATLNFTL